MFRCLYDILGNLLVVKRVRRVGGLAREAVDRIRDTRIHIGVDETVTLVAPEARCMKRLFFFS